jgi:hypothetical protein
LQIFIPNSENIKREKRNAYGIFVRKPEEKRLFGRHRRMREDNIKTDLREIGWKGVNWMHLAQDMDQ